MEVMAANGIDDNYPKRPRVELSQEASSLNLAMPSADATFPNVQDLAWGSPLIRFWKLVSRRGAQGFNNGMRLSVT